MESVTPEYTFNPTYEDVGEVKPPKRYAGTFPIKSSIVHLVPNLGTLERFTVLGPITRGEHIGKLSICKNLSREEVPANENETEEAETPGTDTGEKIEDPNPIYSSVPQCILAETTNTDRSDPFQVVHLTGDFPTKDLVWDESFSKEEIKTFLNKQNIYLND